MPPPTRLAYVLQFDPAYPGTADQVDAIRGAVATQVRFGSPLNKVMHGLAVLVKYHVRFVTVGFHSDVAFGQAARFTIRIGNTVTIPEQIVGTFWHELGHVVGLNYFNDPSEGWAHLFGSWAGNGGPAYGIEDDGTTYEHAAWTKLRVALEAYKFAGSPTLTVAIP